MPDYRQATLTRKQWRAALGALDSLVADRDLYRDMARVQNRSTVKGQQALFLLRGQMLLASMED